LSNFLQEENNIIISKKLTKIVILRIKKYLCFTLYALLN
jgi:hypothetical protein